MENSKKVWNHQPAECCVLSISPCDQGANTRISDPHFWGPQKFCESHMHQAKCIESCSCISAHVALSKSLTSIGKSATGYIQEWYALHQALPITVVSPTRNHPQNHHEWMVNHGPSHGSCLLRNEPQNRHPSAGCKPGAVIMFVMPKIMVTMLRP